MPNPWFRLYSEFMHDPKIQMLSEKDQRRFVMLLCMRCNGDVTLQDEHVTFMLRITQEEWMRTKDIFIDLGFIDSDNNVLNWDKRQFISDSSAARVARHRAKRNGKVTKCNVTETPPEQNRTEQNRTEIFVNQSTKPQCPHDEIIALYHKHLPTLPAVRIVNEKRKKLFRQRWLEDSTRQNLEYWAKLFIYISKSDFLTGKTGTWQADLEWIMNASNFVKIIEGKYENRRAA